MPKSIITAFVLLFLGAASVAPAQPIDLAQSSVLAPAEPALVQTAAQVLVEEVQKRTGLAWPIADTAPATGTCIELSIAPDGAPGPEGFAITAASGKVKITGADARGVLFGVGYLLRQLEWRQGAATLPAPLTMTSKPDYPIRGHQLGYRARANSWDAWTPEQFDQFIRELAIFGTNAIENIPFQDDQASPHMKLSRREMNKKMSEICAKYDLQYWAWVPADFDLKDQAKRDAALKQHEEFYADCPRLDGVFFPGGDPGDNHPNEVMPFLEDLSKILPKYHSNAKLWISPQGFRGEELESMFTWIEGHQPGWLGGLVGGPGSPALDFLRKRLDPKYQLRDYPDITHIVRCQYEVRNLDQAFALTLGRECIMARPVFYSEVFAKTAPATNGFISYSDGVHDDANKILWSQLAWNAKQDPKSILTEYCRFFFGPEAAPQATEGLFALERNWDGPIKQNKGIADTLKLWQGLEAAHPELKDNWRWQMFVLRGYYDAYTLDRLIREQALEDEANAALTKTGDKPPATAMAEALKILQRPDADPVRPDLRDRIIELFDELYKSIQLQTDVKKYQASGSERGCSLEFLDYPLNNRWWLEDEFKKVEALPDDTAKWARLEEIRTWANPGPGSFYDNLGSMDQSPHVVLPDGARPSSGGFAWWEEGHTRARLSWQVTSWARNGLRYDNLDPAATYVFRCAGFGDVTAKADDQDLQSTRYGTAEGEIKEFPVPQELTKDGSVTVRVQGKYLPGVNWRQQPRLSEAWLIKQ